MTRLPRFGKRGEGWVVLQLVALAAVGAAGLWGSGWAGDARVPAIVIALFLAGVGGTLAVAGSRHLGGALTPFPAPVEGAPLRRRGAYGLVRHPIYGGLLLLCVAWSLFTSPLAFVPTTTLALVFEGKRRHEEAWLRRHHADYDAYMRAVPRRFVPFIW